MNTKEKYSTTATVTVNVLDGDDQYPQFLPCSPVYEDGDHTICTNPVYTVNITETDEVYNTVSNKMPLKYSKQYSKMLLLAHDLYVLGHCAVFLTGSYSC